MFSTSLKNIVLISVIGTCPVVALANSTSSSLETVKESKSISYQKNTALTEIDRTKQLKQAPIDKINTQLSTSLTLSSTTAARHSSFDYSLYDTTTDLISDDDFDGFYHRFSITIDADTLFDHATVYADLYLSYEGGPWIYYASTQDYDIHSDSYNDAFTIETELADGYPTGYYDVQIKLYDSITDDYLLSYDNLDDSSLYAIPLEDSHRDQGDAYYAPIETEIIISHGAGSINFLTLSSLFILLITLRLSRIFLKKKTQIKSIG